MMNPKFGQKGKALQQLFAPRVVNKLTRMPVSNRIGTGLNADHTAKSAPGTVAIRNPAARQTMGQ